MAINVSLDAKTFVSFLMMLSEGETNSMREFKWYFLVIYFTWFSEKAELLLIKAPTLCVLPSNIFVSNIIHVQLIKVSHNIL